MSVPMSHEDLQKLRAFIDFVSANPTILNQPALDFVKKFIEKFGGKVPEGEFKIPEGGKCPFGGGGSGAATNEKKEPAAESSDESEPEADMDFEPESELELDMDAESVEADSELLEMIKIRPRKRCASGRKTTLKMKKPKRQKAAVKKKQRTILKDTIKTEFNSDMEDEKQQTVRDPLYFAQQKSSFSGRIMRSCQKREFIYDENISSAKKPSKKNQKQPRALICFENCTYKCSENFDMKQRKMLCTEYWSLNDMGKDEFLRSTIKLHKTKRLCLQKTDRPRREFMCRYFLRASDGQKRGVCSVFYMATLALKAKQMKNFLTAYWQSQQQQQAIKQDLSMIEMNDEEGMLDEVPPAVEVIIQTQSAVDSITMPKPPAERRKLDMSRKLRPINCEEIRCRFNCTSKFSEEQRSKLCAAFWSLDFKRRKDYIISHVQSFAIVTKTLAEFRKTDRPRSHQNHFFLRNEKGESVRVCSRFFTATLSVGSNFISRTLRRSDPNTGTYIGDDMRGHKEPYNKTKPEMREDVKRHIESYPTWVPHKRSKTSYLHSSLSIQKMFNEYKESCLANCRKHVNSTYFRRVFRDDFRLAFLRPYVASPQKVGTAQRNPDVGDNEKSKKIKAPNAFLSDYTGEEGGFWSATTELIELESPIKEVTVTTTIDRAAIFQPQNVVYTTETANVVDGGEVASVGGDNNIVTGNLIQFTNLASQPFVQNMQILQSQPHSVQQTQQQIVIHEQAQSVEHMTASGIISTQYEEHEGDVYHPMM